MVGIRACGVYVPQWRLDLGSIKAGLRGEKAIANFDEDSLTMGVAAGTNCLRGIDRNTVDGLFFASTTFPYREKQVSVTAATALDLRDDILTADFSTSLRAGTTALTAAANAVKAGAAKQVLVVASDMRLPMPGSDFEREFGDGAAALLVSSTDISVAIRDSFSLADEIHDIWRSDEDKYIRSWEERFNLDEGYFRVLPRAISRLAERNGLSVKDFSRSVFNGPNARRHSEMGKRLGLAAEQVQAPMFGTVGDTGTASSLMMLTAAVEKARPGDKLLLGAYGNGADVFLLESAKAVNVSPPFSACVSSKMVSKDYLKYLNWRGLVEMVTGRRRPPTPSPSVTCLWREREETLRLHGGRCKSCGMVQYPAQRICYNCHAKDQNETYRFGGRRATLTTYTEDYATPNPDPPMVLAVIDFEGGGRMWAYMTDRGDKQVEIGMPVEMTFRKLFTSEGIHNYAWKCMPVRFSEVS
ncbi:MAG: hydroxymethylglutaryl-CoA synthase family protein [Chloroflexi bacterium]|nr:hydroxymethylglutaryl-CoA synthase family protein [Chloroflexota bacterium]